ncbi:ABC transporter ATP-binding protein [Profundibacterium mesophilum]|uniref:Aliphatic sulfonates import ATP-binding protein SsuB 2 n=1 Tax=Profundibacterium mesophilum KAUST100406-0324 TaxID=1037889 RepID=A0A921NTZ7_9RHOB|nr:ATP-binding cassette domain-containing protein [Profundibacterium mesophilum]KAF0675161.1 Aliphatic sulfonates import ATP-binding protein SsuB 2 [Profundibacterium mesophilum KAUST100406-0324]
MNGAPGLHLSGKARIGDVPLFGPLTLDVPAGRWTCLLGASGIGKSTILRLFAGIGSGVDFEGVAGATDGASLEGRCALMAQSDLLLPWLATVDNVMLGARLRGETPDRARAMAILARAGLADHAAKRPAALSGGQRQRAALARTLFEERPVVLLDEPFSALDALTRARMQDLAAELLQGRTVLHVTHDAAEAARLGEALLLMTGAGIEETAPPDSPVPRAFDAPQTLALQGALMRRLMAIGAPA